MPTVFSHIIQKHFSSSCEDVATDALAYILDTSSAARQGMRNLLLSCAADMPALSFKTQQQEGSIRPDMWGYAGNQPHVYVVRDRVDRALFLEMVKHIREHGYHGTFYQKPITYFDHGGRVYWTMGDPVEETIIINRCPKEQSYEYKRDHGLLPEQQEEPRGASTTLLVVNQRKYPCSGSRARWTMFCAFAHYGSRGMNTRSASLVRTNAERQPTCPSSINP
jgi:hypothetical protein